MVHVMMRSHGPGDPKRAADSIREVLPQHMAEPRMFERQAWRSSVKALAVQSCGPEHGCLWMIHG